MNKKTAIALLVCGLSLVTLMVLVVGNNNNSDESRSQENHFVLAK